jgi:hypothetical protein
MRCDATVTPGQVATPRRIASPAHHGQSTRLVSRRPCHARKDFVAPDLEEPGRSRARAIAGRDGEVGMSTPT